MKGPSRSRRRVDRLRALCCALLFAAPGCDGASRTARDATTREPVRLVLAERLAAADVQASAENIAFLDESARGLFRSGWHEVSPGDEDGQRWSRRRASSIDVPVVAPAPLTLSLRVTPVHQLLRKADDADPQRLRVLWNGEMLADQELAAAGELLELPVPHERQHTGLNQLELLPSYWLTPRAHRLSWDKRTIGVRLDELALRSEAPQVRPVAPLVRRQGEAIVQRAGSVVTFALKLPHAARLAGRLESLGAAPPPARIRIALMDDAGGERLLLDRALGDGSAAIDEDLSNLEGRFVSLNLAFSLTAADAGGPPPELLWQELRIEGTRPERPPSADRIARGPYNVILLLPDSLRRDHVDLEGDGLSPNARRLAARGVSFENMRSNSSWTRPSVASMFTSLGPISHGIHGLEDKLDPALAYLPQLLKQHGYYTFAILNSPVVSTPFHFGRGYDMVYTYYELRGERRSAPEFGPASEVDYIWSEFVETQLAKAGERPFFLFLHEIDPHSPYEPPEPFAARHDSGLRGSFNLSGFAAQDPHYFDPGELEYLRGLYRGEVAYMDAWLGRLLDVLDSSGLGERTLVVLISDHGEEFYEHEGIGHGKTVFEEQLRVPFILSLPGVLPEGRRAAVEAQTIDLAPTLLDLLGAEIPAAMQGRSLLPWLEAAAPGAPERPIVAHAMNRKQESLQLGRWKLVRANPVHPDRGAPEYSLFDLEVDPGEITDLWQRHPVVGSALRQQLELEIARQAAATGRSAALEPEPIAPEMIEALKALGYGKD
jgi:arylsulfatase A-like enzyme